MKTKQRQTEGTGTTVHKLAYSYRRYSSSNQRDGSSLERQFEMAQEVCSDKGWTLVDLPPDEGLSGFKGLNKIKGTLGTFLKRVNQGEIQKGSVLIIEKMDRFSRDEVDLVIPDFLKLLQNGIEIFSCVDQTHYTLADIRKNPMTLTYAVMAMAMANDYSKSLGNRITKSFDIRLAQCQQGDKYNLGSWKPYWVDFIGEHKKAGEFGLNKHAATITRIVREYIQGRSMYQIAKGLIADKVPTLLGGKWAQGTVANLLRHQCLTGHAVIKGITLKGYYPPVITQKEQEKLSAKLRDNTARKGGAGITDLIANLFRNRCKCFHCEGTITTAKSANHRLYTCKTKRVGQCPSQYSIRVADVETSFFMEFLQQSPEQIFSKQTPQHADLIANTQSSIVKLDKQITEATELLGVVPISELKIKLAALEEKRQTAKRVLDKLNANMLAGQNAPKVLNDIKEIVGEFERSAGEFAAKVSDIETFSHALKTHKPTQRFDKAVKELERTLKDNEVRKKLLNLLPSIVHHLIIDTTAGRYAVVNHNGTQSEWFEVV